MRALAVLVLLFAPIVARAESEAERFYNEGQRAYEAQRYDDALTSWEKSYALSKLPALLFNIAQAQRLRAKPGDCTNASANYKQFVASSPKKSEQRTMAEEFVVELAPCVDAESRPAAAPPSAVAPPLTEQPPATDRKGLRVTGYVVDGAGISVAVTGLVFGIRAQQLANEVSEECRDTCDWNLVKDKDAAGRTAETTQYILYGVGAAAVITGGVLVWLGRKPATSTVAVTPTAGGAALHWSGTW